jgi:hypothetical protein
MANVLIVSSHSGYQIRTTHLKHLYSFKEYTPHHCFYLNLRFPVIPPHIRRVKLDLIVFYTQFLSSRWTREFFLKNVERVGFLKNCSAVKAIVPQDEFVNMDLVCDFVNQFGIDHVFSVAPETEWPVIYEGLDLGKVSMHRVLTGYIDELLVKKINKISNKIGNARPIDIGYRAYNAPYCWGRHGLKKREIAGIFREFADKRNLILDISTREEDTFTGDDWFKFLLRCKYQIGAESGVSILDRDGSIHKRTLEYLAVHTDAGFEETEKECFPGSDGSVKLFAISPRHLEACMTKTCQVLMDGDYSGVLIPWKHYIPIKEDYSNIDEVLEIVEKDALRTEITGNAYRDIVESGKYSYASFANTIVDTCLASAKLSNNPSVSVGTKLINRFEWLIEEKFWQLCINFILDIALKSWVAIRPITPDLIRFRLRRAYLSKISSTESKDTVHGNRL